MSIGNSSFEQPGDRESGQLVNWSTGQLVNWSMGQWVSRGISRAGRWRAALMETRCRPDRFYSVSAPD
jgi:hypothetical protein